MIDELSYPVGQEFKKVWRKLNAIWDRLCCLSLKSVRYVGNSLTVFYAVSAGNITQVFTDGRLNDPVTEYNIVAGGISFISAPSNGVIIQILYQ